MSSIPNLGNDQDIAYEPCPSWCDYRDADPGLHEFGHCTRAVRDREIFGMTIDGRYAGVTVSAATARMPHDASTKFRDFAIRHYLNVVQLVVSGVGFELVFDLHSGDARSFAAALIRAANVIEGLDR
jgi:hypothetical protein